MDQTPTLTSQSCFIIRPFNAGNSVNVFRRKFSPMWKVYSYTFTGLDVYFTLFLIWSYQVLFLLRTCPKTYFKHRYVNNHLVLQNNTRNPMYLNFNYFNWVPLFRGKNYVINFKYVNAHFIGYIIQYKEKEEVKLLLEVMIIYIFVL